MRDNALLVGPLDRVLSLKTLPILESLSSRELVAIAQNMRERFIPRGSVLVRRGELPTSSYLVLDGRVEIAARNPPHAVENGSSVGLLELLAREPFADDARAAVDTLVLELDADDQEDIWEDHFSIMARYLEYLARETLVELREHETEDSATASENFSLVTAERSLNLVERILSLHRVPMLSSESIDAVAELSSHSTEMAIRPGDDLWRRGEVADHFWTVLSGRARVELLDSSSRSEIRGGACLGIEEALADVPRWNDCRAVDELLTLRIAREKFLDVLEDHFPMARHVVMTLAKRLLALRARDRGAS